MVQFAYRSTPEQPQNPRGMRTFQTSLFSHTRLKFFVPAGYKGTAFSANLNESALCRMTGKTIAF